MIEQVDKREGAREKENVKQAAAHPAIEISLILLSVSTVVSLTHLFTENAYLGPAISSLVITHVIAMVTRRLGFSIPVTLFAAASVMVLMISWFVLPSTTLAGIPTLTTISEVVSELQRAWDGFQLLVAPAPMMPGFVIAVMVGGAIISLVADIAAFRVNAPVEAGAPASALFVFGAVLSQTNKTGSHNLTTILFLSSLGAYWLAQNAYGNQANQDARLLDAISKRTLLIAGGSIGLASIVLAAVVGPSIPGMGNNAIIPWRDGDRNDPGSRITVSPLVDIKTRLVNQSDVEVFSVRSEARSYWRLTSLERFDGRIWSSEGRYSKTDGKLPISLAPSQPTANKTVTQKYKIGALSSIWLPAAFTPIAINGTPARYDPISASLLTENETANELTYEVTSQLTSFTQADLKSSPPLVPSSITNTYLALPDNFSPRIRAEAERIVSSASSPYDKALSLQNYFRSPQFTYDLNVGAGHDGNALESFVFETRRGYCEQFAGVYAAMARSVGLPARVAVGFTPGEQSSDGTYIVKGRNGHAWPEVYLEGYGWVGFEPTPGRGIPNSENYTGVPEQQASPSQPSTATTLAPTTTQTPSDPSGATSPTTTVSNSPDQGGPDLWKKLLVLFGTMAALAALWIGGVTGLTYLHRQLRRKKALSPQDQVLVAWEEVGEALRCIGTDKYEWETPLEYAHRVVQTTDINVPGLPKLADLTTSVSYQSEANLFQEDGTKEAEWAQEVGRDIQNIVYAKLSNLDRAKMRVDPRPLLHSASHSASHSSSRFRRS